MKIIKQRNLLIQPGVHPAYLRPDGKICLREEKGWRYFSGILFATREHLVWVYFRRWKDRA